VHNCILWSETLRLLCREAKVVLPCHCQAWIEASTKGAVLLFTAAEIEKYSKGYGVSPGTAGLLGGMGGGIAQAYATMGMYIEYLGVC
jgi:hypothetical protein